MGARKFQLFTNIDLTRATSFAWAKLYVNARKFQLFTNIGLTRATSFARAKLYERANNCSGKFQTHNHCATRLARAKLYSCSKYGAKFTGMVNVIDLLPVEGIVSFELKS